MVDFLLREIGIKKWECSDVKHVVSPAKSESASESVYWGKFTGGGADGLRCKHNLAG